MEKPDREMIEKYGKYDSNWAEEKMKENARVGDVGYSFTGDLAEQVYQRIALTNGVSFAELKRTFPEEFDADDGRTMHNPDYPNIIFWINITEELINALSFLLSEKLITMDPANPMVYTIDGAILDMPLVKRPYKYKHPHWLPVTFSSTILK